LRPDDCWRHRWAIVGIGNESFTWIDPVARQMPSPLQGEHVVEVLERCVGALPFLRLVFVFSITSSGP